MREDNKLQLIKLDVDPRRDDDASPISSYRSLLRPTWMISSLWHKSKYESKFNFELKKKTSQTKYKSKFEFRTILKKKQQTFEFPCCSTREDLSIDVSITIVGLILTKLWWFQLFSTSQNSNFELFWKKQFFEFPCCSIREDLSIDVSITIVGLILTKLWWFQLFSTSQNSNFELFKKKKSNFWVPML